MSKIYIVEDDDAIRTELALALERNGYEALACTTFDHVVDDVLEASPDLVLLDLSLPQTDGQFICRELRSHSDVPIIVLTSRDGGRRGYEYDAWRRRLYSQAL